MTLGGGTFALILGGLVALGVRHQASEGAPLPEWYSCFDSTIEALHAGAEPKSALAHVQAQQDEATRRGELHASALRQLSTDRRWSDPEQAKALQAAVRTTARKVAVLREEADDFSATAGCLENEH